MKNNRFHQHRKEVANISREKDVDIGIATVMLAQEKRWENWGKESIDFCIHVNRMPLDDRIAYFA